MCKWGTDENVRVPVAAENSHTGKFRWADKAIDACIAPIVRALNEGGVLTGGSCCGHGKRDGFIALLDGTLLTIKPGHFSVSDRSCNDGDIKAQPELEKRYCPGCRVPAYGEPLLEYCDVCEVLKPGEECARCGRRPVRMCTCQPETS